MAPFQNCVRWSRFPTKMAAELKIEKRGMKKKSSPLNLLSQSQPNFSEIILGWSPFKIVSVSAVLYPRWPPLLKIEISSNGQNCSILSQKVPKFELYKHNDELFNIYYGIFYVLWTFAYFDRLCKLEKRGDEIKKKYSPLKLLSQSQPNFPEIILGCSPFKIVSVSAVLYPRWPPWLKIEISSNGQNCSILSQKVLKFELYKHNDELFNIYHKIVYELWTFAYFDRLCKLEKRAMKFKKIFSSETTEPISTKLYWNDSWVVLFQNCVRHFRTPTKMAATAELNLT